MKINDISVRLEILEYGRLVTVEHISISLSAYINFIEQYVMLNRL